MSAPKNPKPVGELQQPHLSRAGKISGCVQLRASGGVFWVVLKLLSLSISLTIPLNHELWKFELFLVSLLCFQPVWYTYPLFSGHVLNPSMNQSPDVFGERSVVEYGELEEIQGASLRSWDYSQTGNYHPAAP